MRAFVLLLTLLLGLLTPARADDVSAAQNIIRSQEQAFGRDDAASAWSYASPALQEFFRLPDFLMMMVKRASPPVYRHRSFEFGEARAADGQIAQRVHIVDENGDAWEALYTLEQQ